MFDKIDFNHFFIESKGLIEPSWFPFLNPHIQSFFKSDSIYIALTFNQNSAYVNLLVGNEKNNIQGMRIFIKEMKNSGIRYMNFGCPSKHKKMITLYKYLKCTFIKEIPNSYPDGDSYMQYQLDFEATGRFG